MELYYKLLDLIEGKYTTHETIEEVNHYITHRVSDMQYDYKVTDKLIRTPFPNYEFHYVIVEDDNEFREFVYFFDTIEEELDSREDDEMREQRDRAIKLLNEKTTALFNANRIIESLRKQIKSSLGSIYGITATVDSERSERAICAYDCLPMKELKEEYMHENDSLREVIDDRNKIIESLRNRVLVLEAGVKESERNEEFWKSQYNKYKDFVESMHQKSADFMYGDDDNFPF